MFFQSVLYLSIYIIIGLLFIRLYRQYVDATFPYRLVLAWFFMLLHLLISDLINGPNVVRLRDKDGKAHRLLITKDTKIIDERNNDEGEDNANNEQ